MRSYRPAALLLAAAFIAGCGGAEAPKSSTPSTTSSSKATTSSSSGGITVSRTEQSIGDATFGSSSGIELLPQTQVPSDQQYKEGVGAGASCENTDITPSDENMGQVIDATLCLLNGERADHGLGPLSQDDELAAAAKQHSQDMIRAQYFDHVAPDGSTPVDRIRRTGYIPSTGSWVVGENLAWGSGPLASPAGIVKAWMNSEGHRANILRSSFNQIGFGVYTGNPRTQDGDGATYTTTFGGKSGGGSGSGSQSSDSGANPGSTGTGKSAKVKKPRKAKKARASKAKKKAKKARISLQ